jgi:DNA-binding MarR family transcriptional regulator
LSAVEGHEQLVAVPVADTLELTAGNLSQHLTVLENAGLIAIEKGYEGRRGRTWIQLTKTGRQALHDEIAALKTLIQRLEDRQT